MTPATSPRLAPRFWSCHAALLSDAHLCLVLVEHSARCGRAFLGKLVPMFRAPVERLDSRRVVAGKVRHDVACIQFVGSLGCVPVSPVMRLVEEYAELALLRAQSLDQCDRVVRSTDDTVLVLDEPFSRVLTRRDDEAWLVVVQVAQIALEAE